MTATTPAAPQASAPTDRELLELAAKAVGIERAIYYEACAEDGFPLAYAKTSKRTYWNPLADDGDALRLAVKLEIRASVCGMKAIADWWMRPAMTELAIEMVPTNGDPFAAMRRAIVRAAAEIGKALP